MRFLADESLDVYLVDALLRDGHDVARITAASPERSDEQVLARAIADNRTLVTEDTDCGDLVFREGQPADSGVILLRARGLPAERVETLLSAVAARDDWRGRFAVVTERGVRVVPLPRKQ